MGQTNGVLLMTGDPTTVESVKKVVAAHARYTLRGTFNEPIGLSAELESAAAGAVIYDIDRDPERLLGSIEQLCPRHEDVRFIVVSAEMNGEWVLRAMNAGARKFLLKSSLAEQLGPTLERLVPESRGDGAERKSSVVTIVGAGGGCGATTLAINLANELRQLSGKPGLLIDLDRSYGAVASYLGLEGRYGVGEILDHGERLDADLIASTALRAPDGTDVLISNPNLGPGDTIDPDWRNLPRLIEVATGAYDVVVVDASRAPAPAIVPLIDPSTATLLLLRLNVVHLRMAKGMLTALSEHGVQATSIIPVASHYHRRRSVITLADAQRALYDRPVGTLCDDEASAAAGANYGQPLAECAPRSALRKEIRAFAERVLAARKESVSMSSW